MRKLSSSVALLPTNHHRILVIGRLPVGGEIVLRFDERRLTSANASHRLDFNAVFARRFIPWLKAPMRGHAF